MYFLLAFCIVFSTSFYPASSFSFQKGPVLQYAEEWHLWKTSHGKRYNSDLEELEKHLTWLSNKAFIEQHNINADNGFYSYYMKLNHFADLTEQEYRDQYLTYKKPNRQFEGKEAVVKQYVPPEVSYWPETVDWRRQGAVTRVKNQANCGASYAFASIGALEGAISLSLDKSAVEFSEQNIIDCSIPEGNNGCKGGNMYNSFMYIIFNDGVSSEASYKYQGVQTPCNFSYGSVAATISGIIVIQSGNEEHLQAALTYTGPVAAAVDARTFGFRFYSRGVFDTVRCSSDSVNHAMLIVGYGTTYTGGNRKEFWIVKNSWGTDWGEDGYILMSKNSFNQCGIATDCSYPSL